ncbi:MAG: DUF1573 domain-containing protein [Bacteroidia bacterium]|nr:DUF1573 domain-containing protein [Bacteroidia bacterium]
MRSFKLILLFLIPLFAWAGPHLTADPEVCEMGTLYEGMIVHPIWVLHNDGDQTLHLKQIKSSCGCLSLDFELKDLEPGESMNIQGTWETMGKLRWDPNRNPTEIENTLFVLSDGPRPKIILKAHAMLLAHPGALFAQFTMRDVGELQPMQEAVVAVSLLNPNEYPVEISSIVPSEFEGMNPLGIGLKVESHPAHLNPGETGKVLVSFSWDGVKEGEEMDKLRTRGTQFHRYFKVLTMVPEKTDVSCESFLGISWKLKPD